MHLAPHGTSKMVFPPWREAHFANVALLLLHPFFHQFWNPFSDGFRSIFRDISHPNGDEKFDDFSCCFCCVFSSILGPSWRHLAPFGRDFGRSEPVQNRPKSAKTASWPFFFPRSPPRAPRHPPGIDFLAFRVDFSGFLDRFSLDFRFQFRPFSMDFQMEAIEKAKLERKGPPVLAAGVFEIRRPRGAVVGRV